jgi:flavin reductase (DIM6/NTAB) family NADH-FMN oxidoreductase RutF
MAEDPVKDVLNLIPYGFFSVTSRAGDEVNAMVATWIMQASFDPRRVVLALQKTSHTHGLIEQGRVFAINLFKSEDAELIKPFSKSRSKDPDKMKEARFEPGSKTGCPVLEGAAAVIELKVVDIVDIGGDHDLVVGEPVGAQVYKAGEAGDSLSLPDIGWSYAG